MSRVHPVLAAALVVSACSSPASHAARGDSDAEAVAKAERLSTPPAMTISPQPITFADLEENDMFGAGCYFLDSQTRGADGKPAMLFVASDEKGWLKLEGRVIAMSANRASTQLPYMAWTKYVGLARTVELERDNARARSLGAESETETAPGSIVVRDERDRVVFRREGTVDCGA